MVIAILSYSLPNLIAYTEILLNYAKLIFFEKWQIQPKKKKKTGSLLETSGFALAE